MFRKIHRLLAPRVYLDLLLAQLCWDLWHFNCNLLSANVNHPLIALFQVLLCLGFCWLGANLVTAFGCFSCIRQGGMLQCSGLRVFFVLACEAKHHYSVCWPVVARQLQCFSILFSHDFVDSASYVLVNIHVMSQFLPGWDICFSHAAPLWAAVLVDGYAIADSRPIRAAWLSPV